MEIRTIHFKKTHLAHLGNEEDCESSGVTRGQQSVSDDLGPDLFGVDEKIKKLIVRPRNPRVLI